MNLLLLLAACGGTYALEGQLEDGVFGGPIGGFEIIATADDPAAVALTCGKMAGKVADDGSFKVEGLCAGTSYSISTPADMLLPDLQQVPDGGLGSPMSGKAYRAPGGDGFYFLNQGEEMQPASTNVGFRYEELEDGTKFRYPSKLVPKAPLLAGDTVLMATGDMAEVPFRAMKAHPEGIKVKGGKLPPLRTVGEPVEADAGSVEAVVVGEHKIHIYKAGVVPEGRYTLVGDNAQRMLVLDVGTAQPTKVGGEDAEGGDKGGKKKKGKKGKKK